MKVNAEDIQGAILKSDKIQTLSENSHLLYLKMQRTVLHPNRELVFSPKDKKIIIVLFGKGTFSVNNKIIIGKVNDIILIDDTEPHTILNNSKEDLTFLTIYNE